MRILKPFIFFAAILLMVEISFRIYLFGINSINPMRMNSYTQITYSGITQPASIPAIYYELRPNFDGWYKGTRFTTNSTGLRDDDYPLTKPADSFRIAVVGSSWTMGSGVKQEEIWHSVIENRLNGNGKPGRYEIINFGVDQYGLGELVATLEHKTLAYHPDLILIALTYYTPTVLWQDPPESYVEQKRRNPFFEFYALRVIDMRLNLGIYTDSKARRESVNDRAVIKRQLEKFINRIETFSKTNHLPIAVIKLAYTKQWHVDSQVKEKILESNDHEFVYFDIEKSMLNQGYKPGQLRISNWDSHPNALAHQMIADAVLDALIENDLIPDAKIDKGTP